MEGRSVGGFCASISRTVERSNVVSTEHGEPHSSQKQWTNVCIAKQMDFKTVPSEKVRNTVRYSTILLNELK